MVSAESELGRELVCPSILPLPVRAALILTQAKAEWPACTADELWQFLFSDKASPPLAQHRFTLITRQGWAHDAWSQIDGEWQKRHGTAGVVLPLDVSLDTPAI